MKHDEELRKAYFRKYYQEHKDIIKERSRKYKLAHYDEIRAGRKRVNPQRANYLYIVTKKDKETRFFYNCAELGVFFGYTTNYMNMLMQGITERTLLGYKIEKERR